MPTLKERRQAQADNFYKEQLALKAVIHERMKWHQDKLRTASATEEANEFEIKWHEELYQRDIELLEEAEQRYNGIKKNYEKNRINFPEIDFEIPQV